MSDPTLTVRDLRRRWKPHKERLQRADAQHPSNVRFHRACSWLQRAEEVADEDDSDFGLLCRWIALNALYGQWDEDRGEPHQDRACWRDFLDHILKLDGDGRLAGVLAQRKRLVMSIFDSEYLSDYFWEEPDQRRARKSRKVKFCAQTWYIEENWTLILDRLMERIYFLRCQLVHGAATYNGSMNRAAVRRCSAMLAHLLTAALLVWIDHGACEDWGPMCYPPLHRAAASL